MSGSGAADIARGRSIPDRVTIAVQPRGETITVERGTPLRLVLHEYGIEFPCGGHAGCAGCKVRVTGGAAPADEDEAAVLTAAELADGWRLACRCQADRDLVLQVEQWETVILADQSALEFTPREGLGIAVDLGTTTIVAELRRAVGSLVSGLAEAVHTGTRRVQSIVVASNRERALCASTAAGPAFEGGRIGMGTRASTGAISEVALSGGRFRCQVIGNATPRGICGSGLVDAVACGLDAGWIEASGRLANGAGTLEIMAPVHSSQHDIRQLQLAKAAITAGVRILSRRFGLADAAELPIFLADAFGNYVNRASARRIGLVAAPDARLHPTGNTSLIGAKLALFGEQDDDFAALRTRIEHVPLASDPAFQEIFMRETAFPESST